MSTIDEIALERERFLASSQTRRDWIAYITAVEKLRRRREGH